MSPSWLTGQRLKQALGLFPILAAFLFSFPSPAAQAQDGQLSRPAPEILTRTSEEAPVSCSPVLLWTKEADAVAYEIEFFVFPVKEPDPEHTDPRAIFRTSEVYENAVNLSLDELRRGLPEERPLWWRVRALDLDGQPITPFSPPAPLFTDEDLPRTETPVLHPLPDHGKGSAMLFPVYSWVRPQGTERYEIALYTKDPEKKPAPEAVAKWISTIAEQYDDMPRTGDITYYWRVRALGPKDEPGGWSRPSSFRMEPRHWEVAVLGDSISHGGGHVSHGPEELEYSWLSYLDFPAVNLARSGEITGLMADRFERDVLPFSPDYLLVLCGTNDLRAGEFTVSEAIRNMERLKEKCLLHGIRPIFLTLPPINPANILRVFGEGASDDWQARFAEFNEYLRRQPHIDIAAAFAPYAVNGNLPEWLGLDGLHEDVPGKRLIAARVNRNWEAAKQAADEYMKTMCRKENPYAESH